MIVLIEHGEIFTPQPAGVGSVLAGNDRIWKLGKVDGQKLSAFDVPIETLDATGCYVVPGLVDPHSNILGAGGEQGFASRQSEVTWQANALAGITTVVGCLGADAVGRSLGALLCKARELDANGLSAYIMTGSMQVPPPTLSGRLIDDLVLFDKVIAIGEVAISDIRATEPTTHELARICSEGIMGGNLGGKLGVTHFHVGPAPRRLAPLRDLLDQHDIPPKYVYPTHVTRTAELFDEAIALAHRGCFIDTDTVEDDVAKWLPYYFEHQGPPGQLTISSDAQTPGATPAKLLRALIDAVQQHRLPLELVLPCFTSNPATAFGLAAKGVLRPGADADLLVLRRETLELMHVVSRGRVLVKDGRICSDRPENR